MATASLTTRPLPSLSISRQSSPHRPRGLRLYCSSRRISVEQKKTLKEIHSSGVIACLRANSAELAMEAASAALQGGISVLEIVMSTPGSAAAGTCPSYKSTWRTVLNIEDAKRAVIAGARFLMSPATVKDIMDDFQCGEVLYIPGVMTPTEILSAYDAGAEIVKVYPVSALGGIRYISAIKKPFPHISMVASQGITIDSIEEYIAGGASAVVLSDAIFDKEAMGEKNFNRIHQLANMAALKGSEAIHRKNKLSNL